jgi:repressor LexA
VDTVDPELPPLTTMQWRVLEAIKRSIAKRGFPPTLAELAEAVGMRSKASAVHQLRELERKGRIQRTAGTARGIRVLEER